VCFLGVGLFCLCFAFDFVACIVIKQLFLKMNKKLIGKKGQVIHSQTRENEATIGCPTIPLKNYKERVIAATGISESSYKRIVKQSNEVKVRF
jgi:hypothetical protein